MGLALLTSKNLTARSVIAASDGSTVLGGSALTTGNAQFLLIRLTANGQLDSTFGPSNGMATGPSGGIAALVQQPDAKLVAAGSRIESNDESSEVITRFFGGVCGNATIEPDEACDDGNLTSGDGCDANCTLTGCGNGIPTAGEACDDGNVADGDCCSSTCTLDAAGTACTEDFSLCTNDACDGSGTCVHAYAPAPTCTQPSVAGAASLQVTNANRRVQWRWPKGGATPVSALGDPTTTTSYALCIYDYEGGVPQLEHGASVGGGSQCAGRPCWKATKRGFAYKDKYGFHDSLYSIQLVADPTPGKSKITYKGAAMPALTLPLAQDLNIVVQLRNSVGGCWGATFGTAKRNDTGKFVAKSD
jgi:cysteine-rich repeat protein